MKNQKKDANFFKFMNQVTDLMQRTGKNAYQLQEEIARLVPEGMSDNDQKQAISAASDVSHVLVDVERILAEKSVEFTFSTTDYAQNLRRHLPPNTYSSLAVSSVARFVIHGVRETFSDFWSVVRSGEVKVADDVDIDPLFVLATKSAIRAREEFFAKAKKAVVANLRKMDKNGEEAPLRPQQIFRPEWIPESVFVAAVNQVVRDLNPERDGLRGEFIAHMNYNVGLGNFGGNPNRPKMKRKGYRGRK